MGGNDLLSPSCPEAGERERKHAVDRVGQNDRLGRGEKKGRSQGGQPGEINKKEQRTEWAGMTD